MASPITWFAGGGLCSPLLVTVWSQHSCFRPNGWPCQGYQFWEQADAGADADADPAGDKVRRLAIDATLRAAAPYQRSRRQRAADKGKATTGVFVEKSDMRA